MSCRFSRIPEHVIGCRELFASDWRVFACISLHADQSGRAWPSMDAIAEMTGVRKQDLPRTFRRLERLVGLQYEPGRGRGRRNVYILPLGQPEKVRTQADLKDGLKSPHTSGPKQRKGPHTSDEKVRTQADRIYKQTKEHTNTYTRGGPDESAGWFDRFWGVYPDRGDQTKPKKPAKERFLLAIKSGAHPEHIVRGAENYARAMARYQGDERRYVKQPANWLKDRLWEQYQAASSVAQPKFGGIN
jgi:hypothetical protein